MSLIIKDLDINDLSTDAYCIQVSFFTKDAFCTTSVPINKVIQIPSSHGRLIDADTIKNVFDKGDTFTAFHFIEAIDDAPTILEAEE